MKKSLLFPGAFRNAAYYKNKYDTLEIWEDYYVEVPEAEIYIAHSVGCAYTCSRADLSDKKIIFVNPIISKFGPFKLIYRWIKYAITEKVSPTQTVSVKKWPKCLFYINRLRKINILDALKKLPKENIFIIRGNHDDFFCDKEAAREIVENNFNLIEVNAGHNWNENINDEIEELFKRFERKKIIKEKSKSNPVSDFIEGTFFPSGF